MFDAASQCDDRHAELHALRVDGGVALTFACRACRTVAARVREADGYRVRFPAGDRDAEAVILNTGGGIAGGDRVRFDVAAEAGADACVTSVAAERIYRSAGRTSELRVDLKLEAGSRLTWLPQETILYCGGVLARRIDAAIDPDAALTLADVTVLGRRGSGEVMRTGSFTDHWRLRRGGRLVHAEATAIAGPIDEILARSAVAGGRNVVATLVHVAPSAAERLDAVRQALAPSADVDAAASAWDGKLVVRVLAGRLDEARRVIAAAACVVTGRPLPAAWAI